MQVRRPPETIQTCGKHSRKTMKSEINTIMERIDTYHDEIESATTLEQAQKINEAMVDAQNELRDLLSEMPQKKTKSPKTPSPELDKERMKKDREQAKKDKADRNRWKRINKKRIKELIAIKARSIEQRKELEQRYHLQALLMGNGALYENEKRDLETLMKIFDESDGKMLMKFDPDRFTFAGDGGVNEHKFRAQLFKSVLRVFDDFCENSVVREYIDEDEDGNIRNPTHPIGVALVKAVTRDGEFGRDIFIMDGVLDYGYLIDPLIWKFFDDDLKRFAIYGKFKADFESIYPDVRKFYVSESESKVNSGFQGTLLDREHVELDLLYLMQSFRDSQNEMLSTLSMK